MSRGRGSEVSLGPSPRVRGSRGGACPPDDDGGSIPACAGKPGRSSATRPVTGVHPRVCGEAARPRRARVVGEGPSPRVRGSRSSPARTSRRPRSIPACAGKPGRSSAIRLGMGVHPRVCGEACVISVVPRRTRGPSPRVRGSLYQVGVSDRLEGSIPACAGKPLRRGRCRGHGRVHPRVCGEAISCTSCAMLRPGPSPRVRGSHDQRALRPAGRGSIPACAGKPATLQPPEATRRVHPRVCGEAAGSEGDVVLSEGPSPRVRGSHGQP